MKNIVENVWKYVKSRKYILLLSVVYFLIRLIHFDSYFLLKDERDLILTALSLAQTGKDLYGHSFPLVFLRISPQAPLLGMYWVVPILSFFHITAPLIVKGLYIIPTLFFPLLIFELVMSITKEWKIGFLTSFVVSFSPWYFHISRLGIEAHLAYFFCLLGLIFYLHKKRAAGFILLILSYFSYFGIRPFLLISVPYIEVWNYIFSPKKSWKKTIITLIVFVLLFGCIYIFSSKVENTSERSSNEIILLNKEKLTLETNFLREISDAPFFVRKFVDNKPSIVLHTLSYNFFKGMDFSYLFFSGDYVGIYANQITGQFFPFLFVFLILGICYLAKEKRADYFFVAGFSIVGLVSSLINSYSLTFSIRSVFSLIGIGFICSLGVVYVYELCSIKRKNIFISCITLLYLCFSGFFIYKYLFQNYKTINSSFNEQERYLANYSRDKKVQKIIVPNIHSYFLSYLVTLPSLSKSIFLHAETELNKPDGYEIDGHNFLLCTAEQINPASLNSLPHSSLIEQSCLSAATKLLIDLHNTVEIIKLLNTQYSDNNVDRDVQFYFVK